MTNMSEEQKGVPVVSDSIEVTLNSVQRNPKMTGMLQLELYKVARIISPRPFGDSHKTQQV
uniref:Uncharacterized protein n=1 Tax=Anguilla anguilla TaxID=7936 RepID=A0A0E9TNB7_ANGAN